MWMMLYRYSYATQKLMSLECGRWVLQASGPECASLMLGLQLQDPKDWEVRTADTARVKHLGFNEDMREVYYVVCRDS